MPNDGKDAKKLDHSNMAGENVNGTLEISLAVSYKTKHAITTQFSNCTVGHLSQRNENLHSCKNLYTNVHSTFICDSQKLE